MCFAFPHALRKMRSLEQFQTLPCFLLCAACFLWFCTSASAAPPQAPIPPQAPDLPARVTALEQRVTVLEQGRTFGSAQPCNCGCMTTGNCQCKNCFERTADPTWVRNSGSTSAATSVPAQYEYRQVCDQNGCRLVKVAKSSTPQTFGQFIYDPDSDASPSPQTGPSGQTSAPAPTPFVRVPFRPIHNLIGRIRERRGGGTQSSRGGCSTCGN